MEQSRVTELWQCFNKITFIYNTEIKIHIQRERFPSQKVNTSFIKIKEGEFTMNAISPISVEQLNPSIKEKLPSTEIQV